MVKSHNNISTLISLPIEVLSLIVSHLSSSPPSPAPSASAIVSYTTTLTSSVFPFALTCRKACAAVRLQLAPHLDEILHHCSANSVSLPQHIQNCLFAVGAAASSLDRRPLRLHQLQQNNNPQLQLTNRSVNPTSEQQQHQPNKQNLDQNPSVLITDVISFDNSTQKTSLPNHQGNTYSSSTSSSQNEHTLDCRRRCAWLALAAPRIRSLSISFLTFYHSPSEAVCTVSAFLHSKPSLQKLVLAPLVFLNPAISEHLLIQLLQQSANTLSELQIPLGIRWSQNTTHDDSSMLNALKSVPLPNLKTLVLHGNRNLPEAERTPLDETIVTKLLLSLQRNGSHISELHLQSMPDDNNRVPNLQLIRVAPHVRKVCFERCGTFKNCSPDTLRGYDSVEKINCWACMPVLTDMQSILQRGYLSKLHEVCFYGMYTVALPRSVFENGGSKKAIHFGSFFKHLDIYDAQSLTADDVQYIATDCPNLQMLTLRVNADAVPQMCAYVQEARFLKHFQVIVTEVDDDEDDDESQDQTEPDQGIHDADELISSLTSSPSPFNSLSVEGLRGSVELGIELLKRLGPLAKHVFIPLHSTINVESTEELDPTDCFCVLLTAVDHCQNLERLFVGADYSVDNEISYYIVEAQKNIPSFDGNSFLDDEWSWDSVLEGFVKENRIVQIEEV